MSGELLRVVRAAFAADRDERPLLSLSRRNELVARAVLYGARSGTVAAAPVRPPVGLGSGAADACEASAGRCIGLAAEREAMWRGA